MRIEINSQIYIKNPESSDLGKRIISGSIELMEEIGFESFTFRKLAQRINSTEASIYRYFESKHKLLLYLMAWYWGWMEYKLLFRTANISSAEERLLRAIQLITEEVQEDGDFSFVNEVKLHKVLMVEASKAYLSHQVDEENQHGVFSGIKSFVQQVSEFILEINPQYKYPHMLISTVIEGTHHQRYFAEHLPRLTDAVEGEDSITVFYREMVLSCIKS